MYVHVHVYHYNYGLVDQLQLILTCLESSMIDYLLFCVYMRSATSHCSMSCLLLLLFVEALPLLHFPNPSGFVLRKYTYIKLS